MADGMNQGFTFEDMDHDQAVRDAELARLAALDPISYDKERATAAERLGCRVTTLDEMVRALRPKPAETPGGRGVVLPEVDPWPEPVPTGELLDALVAAIRRHVILSEAAAYVIALWIVHTWIYERFQHTPRLAITSPAKRCGKSTLLDLLHSTCLRPIKADNISAAGTFRTIKALCPLVLLLDEADSFLAENEELRGVLNSGYERNGSVIRVEEVNGEFQPVLFPTFCPVALAGIGKLPGTLEDRSLPIALQRKAPGDEAVKLRAPGARAVLADIARKLARLAADRGEMLNLDPDIPAAFGDREGDICVPLLAIADDAGGEWPGRARKALLDLFNKRAAEEGGAEAGVMLLADLRAMFFPKPDKPDDPVPKPKKHLASAEVVIRLAVMEQRPWSEWKRGEPMTTPQLARLLRPFGIIPKTLRVDKGTFKGYERESFTDPWNRYLPPEDTISPTGGDAEPSHRHIQDDSRGYGGDRPVTATNHVTERDHDKSLKEATCDGVTAQDPPVEGERGIEPTHDGEPAPQRPAAGGFIYRHRTAEEVAEREAWLAPAKMAEREACWKAMELEACWKAMEAEE